MKNAIIIPVYNNLEAKEAWGLCVKTYEFYCNKHNIDLIKIEGSKLDHASSCFDRWLDVDLKNIQKYNRITYVDADTLIRWDAYDFNKVLDENGIEIGVVLDQGRGNPGDWHFSQWVPHFPHTKPFLKGYFNAGFVTFKPKHLVEIRSKIEKYKNFYYENHDSNFYPTGIGRPGGIRLDAMDQTAINLTLLELFPNDITFLPKDFNCHVPYLYPNDEYYWSNYTFDFLNMGIIFHMGSGALNHSNIIQKFWETYGKNYNI